MSQEMTRSRHLARFFASLTHLDRHRTVTDYRSWKELHRAYGTTLTHPQYVIMDLYFLLMRAASKLAMGYNSPLASLNAASKYRSVAAGPTTGSILAWAASVFLCRCTVQYASHTLPIVYRTQPCRRTS